MRNISFILIYFFCSPSFAQVISDNTTSKKDTTQKHFVIGDRIITCSDCKIDFCGNITNSKGDTLGKSTRLQNESDRPLFFTVDNILLTKVVTQKLIDRNKIKSLNVIKCNEGLIVFGDLAKNGIITLELKDTIINSETLLENLRRLRPDKSIFINDILINGLATTDDKIKYPELDKLLLEYDTKRNIYNIKTE